MRLGAISRCISAQISNFPQHSATVTVDLVRQIADLVQRRFGPFDLIFGLTVIPAESPQTEAEPPGGNKLEGLAPAELTSPNICFLEISASSPFRAIRLAGRRPDKENYRDRKIGANCEEFSGLALFCAHS